eukprot:CAMPEP_0177713914 /NCGR_PEP_ID=MMETSP0484_2-20121128/13188_1 /TAXON_ID=354590 /ORGANISM="Rhodomonas lens, Strain RHODO" /LENGTH=41 /DNA_ID= /DNA_START= /DNA_END= /DNA_ORIENTATION=
MIIARDIHRQRIPAADSPFRTPELEHIDALSPNFECETAMV